ncbi:hypothetical protein KCU93_g5508, partial [Aureobasidium melanogenum]
MDMDTTTHSESRSTLHDSTRVKMVQLSGPIKIIIPVENYDNNKQHDCPEKTFDASEPCASVSANNKTMIEQSDTSPIDEHDGGDYDETKDIDCNNPDDTVSSFCSYHPGNEILLKTFEEGTPIKAIIIKYFPATLSCCMVIRFVEPAIFNNTSQCVLKLYDRRFSTQHRDDWDAPSWTPEIEQQYNDFIDCGDAEEFFSYWDAEKERDDYWSAAYIDNRDRWSAAKREAYLQWDSTVTYETEKKAYERMSRLQGEDVPKVFGEVLLDQPSMSKEHQDDEEATEIDTRIFSIPGILIQYIDGFHLTDLHKHYPSEHWQSTVDSAVKALSNIQDCGILNRDVNTRSFIVDPLSHKVMMIDFGMVCFREDAEGDRQWEELQANQDEQGAVSMVMKSYLKRDIGVSIVNKCTERALRLAWRFNQESGENEGGTEEEDEYVRQNKDVMIVE